MDKFNIQFDEDGNIIDFLSGGTLLPTPEENVRQHTLRLLHFEYQYPKNLLGREVPIVSGSNELKDKEGRPVRADIIVYNSAQACANRDQGRVALVIECKKPDEKKGYNQLVSYIFNTSASGGLWTNGNDFRYYRRISDPSHELIDWPGIPRKGEAWDALGRRQKKDLERPRDIKGLLRRCHNRLHGRGVESEEEDLTMDMVRIFLAKAHDEESSGELPEFYCTPEEYRTEAGQKSVSDRIDKLFSDVMADSIPKRNTG